MSIWTQTDLKYLINVVEIVNVGFLNINYYIIKSNVLLTSYN